MRLQVSVKLDTVIVDEAGCVLEPAIPVLLRWKPNNLILIGDHLQLPPYTGLSPDAMMKDAHRFQYHDR